MGQTKRNEGRLSLQIRKVSENLAKGVLRTRGKGIKTDQSMESKRMSYITVDLNRARIKSKSNS
jgi:hypothetical protein